jgi:hypothetical protein
VWRTVKEAGFKFLWTRIPLRTRLGILIVGEFILLRMYSMKHNNHVTSFATILSCVNTAHVFIFTTCFGYREASSSETKYSETCIRRNRKGPKIFSTLDKFPHYTKLQQKKC